jgi:hypothetical protein
VFNMHLNVILVYHTQGSCQNHLYVEFIVGLMVMTNMVYMLCHGVAAVILIKHILQKFPSCSSFGLYLKSKM